MEKEKITTLEWTVYCAELWDISIKTRRKIISGEKYIWNARLKTTENHIIIKKMLKRIVGLMEEKSRLECMLEINRQREFYEFTD